MLSFGDPKDEANMLLDMLSARQTTGQKCPIENWQNLPLDKQEVYFVYLRMALQYAARNSEDISEEAMTYLFEVYESLFKHLVNTDSRLRTAVKNNRHQYLFMNEPHIIQHFQSLIEDKE